MLDLLGAVVCLMDASPRHRLDTVADVNRLIVPPLRLGQCAAIGEGGKLVGWGSWALLGEEAENGLISGDRKLQPEDWAAGDRLWLMDVIAPWGHARLVTSRIRADLCDRGLKGTTIRFRRNKGGTRRYSAVAI